MPLPQIRIGTWKENNSPPKRFSDEQIASRLYDKYNDKQWLSLEYLEAAAGTARGGETQMKDKRGDLIQNVYSGDVSKKEWTQEFLLGERELSESWFKDLARTAGYGVTEIAKAVGRVGQFEKGSPMFRAAQMGAVPGISKDSQEEFLQSVGVPEDQSKRWEDPQEVAARDEEYQYMLSNWLGLGPWLGLPKEEKKPINALRAVELDLMEKVRNEGLESLEKVEEWRRDMIQDRFGYVSDELLEHWALDKVEKKDLEELRGMTGGGPEYRQRSIRPGGMGVEGFKKRPLMGTMAFVVGDLGAFLWSAGKFGKTLDWATTSIMAIKAKPVQVINKVLEKLPTYKYGQNWKWFAKTQLNKSTGKRIPINREINLRNIATALPTFIIQTEAASQVAFDPYELRFSKLLAEMGFGEDSQEGYLNTIAALWDPEDSEAEARAKMALENIMVLPVGYGVAKSAISILGRILRGPKDKAAMYLQRLGTDVEGIQVERQARDVDIPLEKLKWFRRNFQFSKHSWIRKPINYLVLGIFNKTGRLTPAMKVLQETQEGVEKAVILEAEILANRITHNLNLSAKKIIFENIDEMSVSATKKWLLKTSAYFKRPTRKADFIKITKLITNDFDPTKGESFISIAKTLNPVIVKDIKQTRNIIDKLSMEISGSKTIDPKTKAIIESELGHYLRKAFKIHEKAGWSPTKAAREEMQDFLVKNLKLTPAQADGQVIDLIERANATSNYFIKTAADGSKLKNAIFKERVFGHIKFDDLGDPIIEKGARVVTTELEKPKTGVVTKIIKAAKEFKIIDKSGMALPRWFFSAKPKYGYQDQNYSLQFESEIDKALYIVADPKKLSRKDADYITWLKKLYNKFDPRRAKEEADQLLLFGSKPKTGPITTTELRALGRQIRKGIKKQAVAAKGEVSTLVVPKFTVLKPQVSKSFQKILKKGLGGKDTVNVRIKDPKTGKTHIEEIEVGKLKFAATLEYEQALRKFFGEIYDPRYNIMNTVQRMVHWVETEKLLDRWYRSGKGIYFFDTKDEALIASAKTGGFKIPWINKWEFTLKGQSKEIRLGPYTYDSARRYSKEAHQFTYQIGSGKKGADLKGAYGTLEGKWTTPEMGAEVEGLYQMRASGMLGTVTRVWNSFLGGKAFVNMNKTVFSHITHLRNFESGPSFLAANGTLALLKDPDAFAKGIKVITNRLLNSKQLKGDNAQRELEKLYLRLGITQQDPHVGELRALLTEFSDSTGANIFGKMEQVAERLGWANPVTPVKKGVKGVFSFAQKLYFAEDDFWKIIYFEHENAQMTRHLSKLYTAQEIQQWAARMVRDTMPTYSNVGPLLRKVLRKSPVGNFFSFRAEQIRTTFHIFNYGRKEMQLGSRLLYEGHRKEGMYLIRRGALRLAGGTFITGMGSSAYSEASRRIFGITDAEYFADKELIPYNENPLYAVSWKGEPTLISLETNDPYNVINEQLRDIEHLRYVGRMSEEDYVVTRRKILLNMVYKTFEPFYEEAILTGVVATMATMFGEGKALDGKQIFKYTDANDTAFNHMDEILMYAYDKLAPGTLIAAERIYDAANGVPTRTGKYYDLETELIVNMISLRQNKIDAKSYLDGFGQRLSEHTKYISNNYYNLYSQIRQLKKEDTAGVIEAIKDYNESKLTTDRRVAYLINSAKIRDYSPEYLAKILAEKGYNSVEISSFLEGNEFVPLDLNRIETKQKMLATRLVGKPSTLSEEIARLYNVRTIVVDKAMARTDVRVIPTDIHDEILEAVKIEDGGKIPLWSPSMEALLAQEEEIDYQAGGREIRMSNLWTRRGTTVLIENIKFYRQEIEELNLKYKEGGIKEADYDEDLKILRGKVEEITGVLPDPITIALLEEEQKKLEKERRRGVIRAIIPDPMERVIDGIIARTKSRRERKFEGGEISEDHPVSNVKTTPSERIDDNTGEPYEEQMEKLGFGYAEGGTVEKKGLLRYPIGVDTPIFQTQEEADIYMDALPKATRSVVRGIVQGTARYYGGTSVTAAFELSGRYQAMQPALERGLLSEEDLKEFSALPGFLETEDKHMRALGKALVPGEIDEESAWLSETATGLGILGTGVADGIKLIRNYGPKAVTKIKEYFQKYPQTTVEEAVKGVLGKGATRRDVLKGIGTGAVVAGTAKAGMFLKSSVAAVETLKAVGVGPVATMAVKVPEKIMAGQALFKNPEFFPTIGFSDKLMPLKYFNKDWEAVDATGRLLAHKKIPVINPEARAYWKSGAEGLKLSRTHFEKYGLWPNQITRLTHEEAMTYFINADEWMRNPKTDFYQFIQDRPAYGTTDDLSTTWNYLLNSIKSNHELKLKGIDLQTGSPQAMRELGSKGKYLGTDSTGAAEFFEISGVPYVRILRDPKIRLKNKGKGKSEYYKTEMPEGDIYMPNYDGMAHLTQKPNEFIKAIKGDVYKGKDPIPKKSTMDFDPETATVKDLTILRESDVEFIPRHSKFQNKEFTKWLNETEGGDQFKDYIMKYDRARYSQYVRDLKPDAFNKSTGKMIEDSVAVEKAAKEFKIIDKFGKESFSRPSLSETLITRKKKQTGGQVRNYKQEYANYQSRPEQKKNRAGRNAARRTLTRTGRVQKGDGKDVDHRDGNPRNNSPANLSVKSKSNNRSFSRKRYQEGGQESKFTPLEEYKPNVMGSLGKALGYDIFTRGLGLPKEGVDGRVFKQSRAEAKIIREMHVNRDHKNFPSPDAIKNTLNHLHLSELYNRQQPDQRIRNTVALELKELVDKRRYAQPFKGRPFSGVKDSFVDSWNNFRGADWAKLKMNEEESSLHRMDEVMKSIDRNLLNEKSNLDEDVMFYDYQKNKFYN